MKLLRLFVSAQFATFLLVGGTAATVNFLSGLAIRHFATSYAAYVTSVAVGFVLGTIVSFVLNRRITFGVAHEPVVPQAIRFAGVAAGSVLVGLVAASTFLGAWTLADRPFVTRAQAESLGHLTAIAVCLVYNFLAMKFFAFRRRHASPEARSP